MQVTGLSGGSRVFEGKTSERRVTGGPGETMSAHSPYSRMSLPTEGEKQFFFFGLRRRRDTFPLGYNTFGLNLFCPGRGVFQFGV